MYNMRKDIYERIKIMKKESNDITPNFALLAKQYGCDYRTIKRYWCSDFNSPPEKKKKPSKLDDYKIIIQEKLKLGCKYSSIYYLIKKKGYTGKYTILRDYCNFYKIDETKKATIRFETNPGLQAQVDWKENMTLYSKAGEPYTINIFLTLLGYSRLKYVELTLDKAQDTLFKCMIHSFKYYGGIPKEIIFDNMKTVVDHSKSNYLDAVINEKFYEFSKDMGFEVWTCRPFRPQTKGKVENLAKIMERLRAFNYEFSSIDELDVIIKQLNNDLNNEISQATGEKPFIKFSKEKEYLRTLPSLDIIDSYIQNDIVTRLVSKESLVTFNNRKYSVDPKYIGKTVSLVLNNDTLEIYFNKLLIKSHKVSSKKFNYAEDDYINILKSDAMKHSSEDDIKKTASFNLQIYDNL